MEDGEEERREKEREFREPGLKRKKNDRRFFVSIKKETKHLLLTLERDKFVDLGRGRDLRAVRASSFGSEGADWGEWCFLRNERERKRC